MDLSRKAERRSRRRDEEPHFRCVLCWVRVPWHDGCADRLERTVASLVDQRIFVDVGHGRKAVPVTDGGLCSDCWCVLEPIGVTEAHEEQTEQVR